jgi:DNA-binding MarR family transcriptional regulator
MQKAIRTLQSFTRFYCSMALQWEKNLLCKGYDLYEIRTLLELYFLGVCTPRELASRLDTRVENMHAVLMRLQDEELIQKISDWKDPFFSHVYLTDDGKNEAKKLQTDYENTIAFVFGRIGEEEQKELTGHLKRVRDILLEAEIKRCEVKAKGTRSKITSSVVMEF